MEAEWAVLRNVESGIMRNFDRVLIFLFFLGPFAYQLAHDFSMHDVVPGASKVSTSVRAPEVEASAVLPASRYRPSSPSLPGDSGFRRLKHNNEGLTVDLGVGLGAWPLPMDYDGDGLVDLVVVCADVPYDGVFFFRNTGREDTNGMPVFAAARKLGEARKYLRPDHRLDRAPNVRVSYMDGRAVILSPGKAYPDFKQSALRNPVELPVKKDFHGIDPYHIRANQWQYLDYDGNGVYDLMIGLGYWGDYRGGTYDKNGQWTGGPLHGSVVLIYNKGTNENPVYEAPRKLKTTDGIDIDVFGWPSPVFADFTGNGKLDLLCGEFRDGFTFYKNVGTRTAPLYAPGVPLTYEDKPVRMDLCLIVPVGFDFTGDGHTDLIVGDEAGRVALMKHSGEVVNGVPRFLPPKFFQQEADEVKFGALATPVGFDWNGDGRDDIVSGNTEGQIGFIENLGGYPVKWARPRLLKANNEIIRIEAGVNGSLQGPSETKWGYTSLSVADWDHDGLPDLVVNSVWGRVMWYKNVGTRKKPELGTGQPIDVAWNGATPKPQWNWWDPVGKELVTQWRTTPVAIDWTRDGLTDLVMLDHEGYLALFRRDARGKELILRPGERIFRLEGEEEPLRLNKGKGGGSGRRKLSIADLDEDGRLDLLVNSINANLYRNVGEKDGVTFFRDEGPVDHRVLAGHSASPSVIDLDDNGKPELLVGAEDGFFYHLQNP